MQPLASCPNVFSGYEDWVAVKSYKGRAKECRIIKARMLCTSGHLAVRQFLQTIESDVAKPLSVAQLADGCELSHNQVTHLFRAQVDDTRGGYIIRRRLERANHLLTRSTLSIKAVAAQVGIRDLHQFNKTVHHATGLSPRRMREKSVCSSHAIGRVRAQVSIGLR